MASSSGPNRSYNNRAPSRNQMIYVPKHTASTGTSSSAIGSSSSATGTSSSATGTTVTATDPRPSSKPRKISTPSLTSSLRGSPSSSSSKPQGGSARGNFVIYLPHDEAVAAGLGAEAGGIDAVESQSVVDFLNDELSKLLKMNPKDFWREVARNDSLLAFLDSYLQFRHRWYDFPHRGATGTVAGVIVGEIELSRRVFMVLYRISSNRDPGASSSNCLSIKDHTALLQEKKLLDLPRLLDVCAIYGHENEELTRSFVGNAMKSQPQLVYNLTTVVSHFLGVVHTMHQRCSSSLELISSGNNGNNGHEHLLKDILEVMDFINDAVVTLDAFVIAFHNAPLYFSISFEMSYGNEELLTTLARLHDSLLPSLRQVFTIVSNGEVDAANYIYDGVLRGVTHSLRTLSLRIVSLGWKLLDFCYLRDEPIEDVAQTAKMFPFKVEDPAIRGDIIVQTFRDINGEVRHDLPNTNVGTFLHNVEFSYNILRRIGDLRISGWIFIDEEQFQYLYQIATPAHLLSSWDKQEAPMSSRNDKLPVDEDSVILESKISQIKDIFPDYGRGFISACLEVYNQNPEDVIQRILEGSLHDDLLSLDTTLEQVPPPKSISKNYNDKGKGILLEPESQNRSNKGKEKLVEPASLYQSDKGKGKLVEPISQSSSLFPSEAGHSSVDKSQGVYSSPSYGRFTRKSKDSGPDSEVLDSTSAKDAIRSSVLAAEYEDEYDDEYDDSFDDLGLGVVGSGFEETENLRDTISSRQGKSWGSENENSSGGSGSKWSQKKTQFYVKDGKNYSYKVAGSIAVSSSQEAALVNQAQKETMHGLGRGGNIPLGAVKQRNAVETEDHQNSDAQENSGRGSSNFSGRGGGGRRGGGRNTFRKDRAMKKHFQSLGGH